MTRHPIALLISTWLCGALAAAQPQLLDDATLELDNWRVTLSTFNEKWHTFQPATMPQIFRLKENRTAPDGARQLQYNLQIPGAAPGELTLALTPAGNGGAHIRGTAKFAKPSAIKFLCLQGSLPISLYGTAAFEADGKRIPFPKEFRGEVVISRPVKQFRLPTVSGEILLEGDFFLRIQDGRKWNGAGFGIRIGFLPHTGQQVSQTTFDFQIRHGKAGAFGPALGNVYQPPVVAAAGKEWKPFTYHRNVQKNSALDFSGFLDAPAGKYGPLVVSPEGKFIFRDRPGIPVRFYGANFVGDSQLPNRQQAEELADRLAAFGFNVVRIHHHDNEIYDRGGNNPSRIDPERVDRLDYLLACLKKRGIYYTTDVYVSRRNIPAAELGSAGAIATPNEYKALFYINDDVYADWERWAKAFLTRVNPHTGLALKDDPALISLSLVNEGNPDSWWNRSPRAMPLYNARFAEWKKTHTNGTFVEFLSELTSGRYRQMAEFLRGLGCRALLTDQNFHCNLPLAASRSLYDFVDNHAYWDHPRFAEKPWQLPVLPTQSHPLAARPGIPGQLMPSRLFGKPFTVSEFDYANPNQFRAVGPALMAAYAAFQAWDGLFPFAYAHSLNAVTNPANTRGFFDIATDPVKTFSQRLGARLFLHGGIRPAERAFAAVVTSPFRKGAEAEAPLPFSDLGFLARIGLATSLPLPGNRVAALIDIGTGAAPAGGSIPSFTASEKLIPDLIQAGLLPQGCFDAASGRFTAPGGQLELNRKQRTLRITAPGEEVLAPAVGKTLQGRLLAVEHSSVPAVFALLPVDGDKLDSARRMTLFHLTNTQATGMKFGNAHLDRLESWGKLPFLARRGTAQVTLRLPRGNWELYALDTAGKRIARVTPETAPEGALRLALDNARYPEAVFAYELIRK